MRECVLKKIHYCASPFVVLSLSALCIGDYRILMNFCLVSHFRSTIYYNILLNVPFKMMMWAILILKYNEYMWTCGRLASKE